MFSRFRSRLKEAIGFIEEDEGESAAEGDGECKLCAQFQGTASKLWLCSHCYAAYKIASSSAMNAGLIGPSSLERWRPTWRKSCRIATAVYEQSVEEALDSLAMSNTEFETFLGTLPKPKTLAEAVRQLPKTVEALKAKGFLLTPDQAKRVAAPCVGLIGGNSLDCLVREHAIKSLHPMVLRQWDKWMDDGRDQCLWAEIYQSPVYSPGHMTKVSLPVAFEPCDRISSSDCGEGQDGSGASSSADKGHITYIPWQVQVRNRDPCNFASIVPRRQLCRERMLALAMGWHPRLGARSPLQAFFGHSLLLKLVAEFLRGDGVFDEVKWLRFTEHR